MHLNSECSHTSSSVKKISCCCDKYGQSRIEGWDWDRDGLKSSPHCFLLREPLRQLALSVKHLLRAVGLWLCGPTTTTTTIAKMKWFKGRSSRFVKPGWIRPIFRPVVCHPPIHPSDGYRIGCRYSVYPWDEQLLPDPPPADPDLVPPGGFHL